MGASRQSPARDGSGRFAPLTSGRRKAGPIIGGGRRAAFASQFCRSSSYLITSRWCWCAASVCRSTRRGRRADAGIASRARRVSALVQETAAYSLEQLQAQMRPPDDD
jgi:hypothetical protein